MKKVKKKLILSESEYKKFLKMANDYGLDVSHLIRILKRKKK